MCPAFAWTGRLRLCSSLFFFFNDTATTEIYTLSLHDALPISHKTPGTPRHALSGEPPFDEDVGPDPGDRCHFQRQRLTEILGRLSANCAERVSPSKNPGRQEKEHPVHDPFAQGRSVYLRTAFDQERRHPSPPQF